MMDTDFENLKRFQYESVLHLRSLVNGFSATVVFKIVGNRQTGNGEMRLGHNIILK